MNNGPFLSLTTLLLELKVLLEDGSEAVSLEDACLVDQLLFVGWKSIQVKEQWNIVPFREQQQQTVKPKLLQ